MHKDLECKLELHQVFAPKDRGDLSPQNHPNWVYIKKKEEESKERLEEKKQFLRSFKENAALTKAVEAYFKKPTANLETLLMIHNIGLGMVSNLVDQYTVAKNMIGLLKI